MEIIPRSIATSGLLAYILVAKFVDHIPFYRQEQQFSALRHFVWVFDFNLLLKFRRKLIVYRPYFRLPACRQAGLPSHTRRHFFKAL